MDIYSITKIIHIFSTFAWMAALFYLPRLLAYHALHANKPDFVSVVRIQEKRLYFAIAIPAMIVVLLSGIGLLVLNGREIWQSGSWLHLKLTFVVLLIIFHHVCGYYVKKFAKVDPTRSAKFFKIINEIPTIILIVILIAVVLRF
ncbi:MAG: protoporphyrinogen oxidase HemJ [Helicobacter sp.]|nr:protoporphyrinogen oxidase HemJ [Helicobacter sp.]